MREAPLERGKLAETLPKIAACSLQSASPGRDNYAERHIWAVNSSAFRDWVGRSPSLC